MKGDTDLSFQEFTLADLFHLPYGALLEKQGIDYLVSGRWPNVTRSVLGAPKGSHSGTAYADA